MSKRVLIAITTYNRLDFTKQCIETLYKNTNPMFEVVVYDNASTDGTREYLMTLKHENLNVIYSDKNIGVAKAINRVLELRQPDQHFMKIDNDITFDDSNDKDWLNNICNLLEAGLEVETNDNMKFKIGAICLKPDKLLKEFPMKMQINDYIFEFNPEGVLGCCTLYSRDVFSVINKFNEDMGLYGYEDSLINIRLFKLGYLSFFETKTKCYHIDPGGNTDYLNWKHKQAQDNFTKYKAIFDDYTSGARHVSL